MRRVLLVLSAALAAIACGPTEVHLDGGTGDAATGPAGRIVVESAATVTLTYEETADIEVTYLESGTPQADVPLRFALDGTANDAALDTLEVTTDGSGRARTRLMAGTVRSVFRVRVSAERAPNAWVNVSVSDAGFGGLDIEAVYDGARTEYARRVITVYSETPCDPTGSYPASAIARQVALEDASEAGVSFTTLPAGLTYTVVGVVEGAGGTALATACVDGLEVAPDELRPVFLRFDDADLAPQGGYSLELEVAADAFGAIATRGVDAGLAGRMPRADDFLAGLVTVLRDRGDVAEADALEMEVGTLALELQPMLTAAGADPAEGLRRFFARLLGLLRQVRVSGPLMLTWDGVRTAGTWDAADVTLGSAGDPDAPPPLPLAPMEAGIELAPILGLAWVADTDTLDVEALALTIPLSALVNAAIEAARVDPSSSPGGALRDAAGCGILASWVVDSPTYGPICDAACADAACMAALAPVLEAAEAAVSAEPGVDAMTVRGSVSAFDDDGDLSVDRLDGTLAGTWEGSAGVVEVAGGFSGVRTRPGSDG